MWVHLHGDFFSINTLEKYFEMGDNLKKFSLAYFIIIQCIIYVMYKICVVYVFVYVIGKASGQQATGSQVLGESKLYMHFQRHRGSVPQFPCCSKVNSLSEPRH